MADHCSSKDFRTYSSSGGNGTWSITIEGQDADGDWQDVVWFSGHNGTWDGEEADDLDEEVNGFFEDLKRFEELLKENI